MQRFSPQPVRTPEPAREPLEAFDAYYAGSCDMAQAVHEAKLAVTAKRIPAAEEATHRRHIFEQLILRRLNRGELVQPSAEELRRRA